MKWNELDLGKDKFAEADTLKDWDAIPEERGPAKQNLPMGRFAFLLPANLSECWGVAKTEKHGPRAFLNFNQEPLLVVQAPGQYPDAVGLPWYGLISGTPRNRARKGEPDVLVADLLYLLKYGLGYTGPKPGTNEEMVKAITAYAGKSFAADNEWSAYCSKTKVRYIFDPETNQTIEDPEGKFGCGANFYPRDIRALQTPGGEPVDRWACGCGAALRAFQNLARFGLHGGAGA